ncbi:acyltransferase family protein [Taibaiella soli]|uniref:Acyltransferase n=1 Tax=Taibaiella soli TaxID=1649169 RepID=A0A2W2B623_9BACT|nr:acyltransferase family protein [Taibaiella soli]PZF71427.1 hypothetical protein DN068_19255 [Taibaiella soli]
MALAHYRKDIQGLRAVAVLCVFIFHLNRNWLPGGFVGVDIFFVISGYLISSIILSETEQGHFSFIDFYKRRIKRIVPAYYALLIIVTIAAAFVYLSTDIMVTIWSPVIRGAVFYNNHWFAALNTYFGTQNTENPFLHTWTLAVEMQFYLFLPLLLVFVKRKWLLPVISFLIAALLAYSTFKIFSGAKSIMYYSLLARMPEFLIGSLLSIGSANNTISRKYGLLMSCTGIALIVISCFCLSESSPFPGVLSLLPCGGAALLLLSPDNTAKRILETRAMIYTGELSYAIYLWHWPIMAFFRYYFVEYEFAPAHLLYIIVLTSFLALLSFYGIEKPMRKVGNKMLYGYLISSVAVFGILFFSLKPLNERLVQVPPIPAFLDISKQLGRDSHGAYFKQVGTFGDTTLRNDDKKILLIGDSHAFCMNAYFDYLGKIEKFRFRTISASEVPLIPGVSGETTTESYNKLIPIAEREIANSRIIIFQMKINESRKNFTPVIINFIKSLRPDQSFILMSDWPNLFRNPYKANKSIVRKNKETRFQKTVNDEVIDKKLLKAIDSLPNCYYLNISQAEIFKDAPFYHDSLIYCDANHINLYASILYAKETAPQTMKVLNEIFVKMRGTGTLKNGNR